MKYVKIKTGGTLMEMPELYKASWDLRGDETTQDFCAQHDNWLVREDTPAPEYDPETQYVTHYYEEQNGKAVQVWEVHDKEPEPQELENEQAQSYKR